MTTKYKKIFEKSDFYYNEINKDMQEKINGINNKKNYEYVFDKKNIMSVYLDDKLVMKCEYSILGMYNVQLSVWYWSWAVAFINKSLIEMPIKKVKDFSKELDDNYNKFNKVDAEIIHYFLTNDNFYIAPSGIDKIIKLGLYLTKALWFFPVKMDGDRVQYVLVEKVLQY